MIGPVAGGATRGFRWEGLRREAIKLPDGSYGDVAIARLADDLVGGPTGFSGVMNSALPRKRSSRTC